MSGGAVAMMTRCHVVDPLEQYLAPTECSGRVSLVAVYLSGRWLALDDGMELWGRPQGHGREGKYLQKTGVEEKQ